MKAFTKRVKINKINLVLVQNYFPVVLEIVKYFAASGLLHGTSRNLKITHIPLICKILYLRHFALNSRKTSTFLGAE